MTPDIQDLTYFLGEVGLCLDYEGPIEQIDRQTVRGHIVCSSDLGDTSIGSHYDDWGLVGLEGSIEEREALNVKHMYLIDEENTRYNFSTSLFSPLGNFLINLLTDFWLDFSNISRKQSLESLRSRIDDIDLMKSHSVHDFLSLLKLTLWALDESSLGSLVVEIT